LNQLLELSNLQQEWIWGLITSQWWWVHGLWPTPEI